MASSLTTGAIADINNGAQPSEITLQVLAVRKFPTGDRCRMLVSDGVHSSGFAILASQLNHMVTSGQVAANTVVQITRYFCNDVADKKKMMIILEMKVLLSAEDAGDIIGSPVAYTGESSQQAPAAAARPAANNGRSPLVQRNLPNSGASPAPSIRTSAPNVGNSCPPGQAPPGMPNVRTINTLTPYQNKWTICARVTNKSSIRTWSNSRGEGKLFSMDLLDQDGEIRATAFNAECDKFYEMIEANHVFYISGATLKTANKQYSSLKNDYEMTFNAGTQVVPCHEESSIPAMQFDFITLEQLESAAKDSLIDLVGVCREAAELSTVTQRTTGKELRKRDLTLVDSTNRAVNVTMWGDDAEKFDGSGCPVLAIKGARVSDFGGVSLSLVNSSTVLINPEITEAHQLKGWWEQTGSTATDIINLSNNRSGGVGAGANAPMKTILEAKREGLGSRDAADYYTNKSTVALIRKENILYMSCPGDNCNKKVLDMSNGMYRCEKCNREYDRFNWRLMVSCNLADFTDNQWVTMFQEQAETLLSTTAQELGVLRDENPDMFNNILSAASFKEYIFRMRVKMETYNDESRLKTTIVSVQPINLIEYNKRLLKEIKEMS